MKDNIRWGILGCGKIAHKFASDLKLVKDATLTAVASRDAKLSKEFANQYGAQHAFSSYDALVSSTDVDVIYIATPHGLHYEHVLLCLRHKKAVLCEKAFALNSRQAEEMISVARANKVFLMEAFWTKFLPQYEKVRSILSSGELGDLKWIQADFGFCAPDPPAQRLYDPLLGGGSLLDVGIYPVFLTLSILGKPDALTASIVRHATGVDEQWSAVFTYKSGVLATLSSSFVADTPVEAVIAGTKGRIEWRNRFHNAIGKVHLALGKDDPHPVETHVENGYGYQFEARHVGECLRKGLTESPVMTHADTMLLMNTLDDIRKVCGIKYPVD